MTKEELEKEKCELLGIIQGKDKTIKDLEWQLQEVAKDNDNYQAENKELEKENADLKMGLKWDVDNRDELLKENAELKKQQFSLRNERNAFLTQNEQYEKDLMDINENLAKAKELLKKMEKIFYSGENATRRLSKISDVLVEAEQFISGVKE